MRFGIKNRTSSVFIPSLLVPLCIDFFIKNYMIFLRGCAHCRALGAVALLGLVGVVSCDDTFDLSNVSTDITLGGTLTVPIGTTDTLRLSRLIDETDELRVDENGAYALMTDGDMTVDVARIEPVHVNDLSALPLEAYLPVSGIGSATVAEFPLSVPIAETMVVDSEVDVPAEVESLTAVEVEPMTSHLHVKISTNNASSLAKLANLRVEGFKMQFPDVLVFGQGIEGMDYSTNTLTSNIVFDSNGDFDIPLEVVGLKDLPSVENGKLRTHRLIPVEGTLLATGRNVSASDLDGLKLTMNFLIPEFSITKVEGVFDTNIDIASEVVSLGEIPDILKDEETEINLNEIGLAVDVENPVGVPFRATLHLEALDESGQRINAPVTVAVDVAKAAGFDAPSVSRFFITNSAVLQTPAGYERVLAPDLNRLVKRIPSSIRITSDVDVDRTQSHFLYLGRSYTSAVAYNVSMPFDFGENSRVVYRETVDNLASDLEDISDKVSEMEVAAEVYSTVPMELMVKVTPYDTAGNDMSDRLDYTSTLTLDPGAEGADPQPKEITLKERVDGSLESLDRLEIVVTGDTKGAVTVLKPSQYVLVKLSARVLGGVDINEDED